MSSRGFCGTVARVWIFFFVSSCRCCNTVLLRYRLCMQMHFIHQMQSSQMCICDFYVSIIFSAISFLCDTLLSKTKNVSVWKRDELTTENLFNEESYRVTHACCIAIRLKRKHKSFLEGWTDSSKMFYWKLQSASNWLLLEPLQQQSIKLKNPKHSVGFLIAHVGFFLVPYVLLTKEKAICWKLLLCFV